MSRATRQSLTSIQHEYTNLIRFHFSDSSSPPTVSPGILGPDSPYVRLVSANDHEFIIRRELAEKSVTIRNMLHVPGSINPDSTVHLPFISPRALHCICAYLNYQKLYVEKKGEVDPFEIEPDLGLELMLAASFLNIWVWERDCIQYKSPNHIITFYCIRCITLTAINNSFDSYLSPPDFKKHHNQFQSNFPPRFESMFLKNHLEDRSATHVPPIVFEKRALPFCFCGKPLVISIFSTHKTIRCARKSGPCKTFFFSRQYFPKSVFQVNFHLETLMSSWNMWMHYVFLLLLLSNTDLPFTQKNN